MSAGQTGQTGLLVLSNTQLENSLEEEEETADVITDNAMENSGLGMFHLWAFIAVILITSLKVFLDGMPELFMQLFQCNFHVEFNQITFLPGFAFGGSVAGALIGGPLADHFGRRIVLIVGLIALIPVTAILAGSFNYAMLIILVTLFSMLVQGIYPVLLVYIMELSTTRTRFITLLVSYTVYAIWAFFIPLIVMPFHTAVASLTNPYWRIPWGLLVVPIVMGAIFIFLSTDSPRFHSAKGNKVRTQSILDVMYAKNDSKPQQLTSLNAEMKESCFSLPKLFVPPLRNTTILLTAFFFVCTFHFFASQALTEEMLTDRCHCGVNILNSEELWRPDNKCGVNHTLDSGGAAECNPHDSFENTCCIESTGMCGKSSEGVNCTSYSCGAELPPLDNDMGAKGNTTCKPSETSQEHLFMAFRNLMYLPGFAVGIICAQKGTRRNAFIQTAFFHTFMNGFLFVACKFLQGRLIMILANLSFMSVISAMNSLSWLYTIEYYPTSLRCTGLGFLAGVGQLGNAFGSLLGKMLTVHNLEIYGRLTIHLFLSIVLTILAFFVSKETRKLPMSDRRR